ncbi:MAG: OmpA family protein [Bacteroidales bacterium]|nr:OmpA family protein [Bacteroidales bacterium]
MRFPIRTIAIILVVCSLIQSAYSQKLKAKEFYEQGKIQYDESIYPKAIELFSKAVKDDPKYTDAWNSLGNSYYYNKQYKEAVEAYANLEKLNPDYWAWFYYNSGQSYEALNKPDEAIAAYQSFLKRFPQTPNYTNYHHQAKYRIAAIEGAKILLTQPNTMKDPVNLGLPVNSISDEYMPQINPMGTRLYFTSVRKGGFEAPDPENPLWFGEDLYYVEQQGNTWGKPVLLPEPINSYNNDATSTFSGDGQTLIYVKCGLDEGIGGCDLYIAQLEGDTWSKPINLGNVVNTGDWDSQPSMSADGTKIIFSSDRDGGYGGSDLYLITKNQFGDWGVPSNLGPVINTPFTEKSPYIAADGKTLYFSSYGHPGFGNADIFKSVFENSKWSSPVNLGQPLNSAGDDNYFTISASGEKAFFASTRTGGNGEYDLYEIEIPESMRPQPTVIVSGKVTNAKTNEPTGAWVLVEDLSSGELIATNKSNSKTGEYLIVLPAGRNYGVSANKEGFFFYSQNFDLPEDVKYQEIKKDIVLKPIEKGTKVVLNNIFFETGKADLKPESFVELAKAVELLRNNRTMIVEIGGHTDNIGSDEANMKLSHNRAKSVRDYMVSAGIASERLQAKGYGKTEPIAANDTPEGRQANRRTEFVILEN